MSDSIPALIAEARRFDTDPAEYAVRLNGAHDLIARLADALESLSAPPATDDERDDADIRAEAERLYANNPNYWAQKTGFIAGARWESGRRVSPVTREALAKHLSRVACDWTHNDCGSDNHDLEHTNWEAYLSDADAILSAFSLPEPAEVEWEYGLRKPFDAVPRMTGSESLMVGMQKIHGGEIFKRTAPGDWIPVKGTEQ